MIEGAKEAMMKKMMAQTTPSETPIVQTLAETVAQLEYEQAEAVVKLADATDHDLPGEPMPVEDRKEQLLGVADAVADREFAEWWFEAVGAEILDNPDRAIQYTDLDPDEWRDQWRDWHQQHYQEGTVDDDPSEATEERHREVAAQHVQAVYGVDLDTFENVVIQWSAGWALQDILAGPIQSHTALIEEIAEEA